MISFVSCQMVITPFVTQCPGNSARMYEKNYPCNWADYILIWDLQPIYFVCNKVPQSYNYNYLIKNNNQNNINSFSAALFADSQDGVFFSEFSSIQTLYNRWAYAPMDVRFISAAVVQPLNAPYYQDFSGIDQSAQSNSPITLTSTNQTNGAANMVILFINRENSASQFPCFDLTVSLNVF